MNEKIQSITTPDSVVVHMPDGGVLSGPRGTSAGEFLEMGHAADAAPLVAAIVNDELRELTYAVQMEARLAPVTMADADGALIYRRSLTFMLSAAFTNLFPASRMTIDHSVSSGGYFCQVIDRPPLSNSELDSLKNYMCAWVARDEVLSNSRLKRCPSDPPLPAGQSLRFRLFSSFSFSSPRPDIFQMTRFSVLHRQNGTNTEKCCQRRFALQAGLLNTRFTLREAQGE